MTDQPLLTIGQAARVIGVHSKTLRSYADAGEIECVRLPSGHRRFLRSDIEAFLRNHAAILSKEKVKP